MRRFNPEKELRKLHHGNRNKIIFGVMALLLIISIESTYALYQVRYSKRIIYTKVAPFSNKDIQLAVYLGNEKSDKFPERGSEYIYDYTKCDNGSVTEFNTIKWQLDVHVNGPDKCDVYFKKVYKDTSGANVPELYQGLIPVTIADDGTIKVADITKEWYNYTNRKWANAVLVDSTKYYQYVESGEYKSNTTISMADILQMYVWIPRYKYQLFNAEKDGTIEPQMINITFERGTATTGEVKCEISLKGAETCTNATNGKWYTHPAFTFGDSTNKEENAQLTGIWVGKFEASGTTNALTVKPNMHSLVNINLATMFDATRNMELQYASRYNINVNELDVHITKNMEWGAIAYLSSSIYGRYTSASTCVDSGCEVWLNNVSAYTTGCSAKPANSGDLPYISSSVSSCDQTTYWNGTYGRHASTTDNITGVYDMNGGTWDYTMGFITDSSGNYYPYFRVPNQLNIRYYDIYEYGTSSTDYKRGHLGDATREVLETLSPPKAWRHGARASFAYLVIPSELRMSFSRGGSVLEETEAGIFSFSNSAGMESEYTGFRTAITPEAE